MLMQTTPFIKCEHCLKGLLQLFLSFRMLTQYIKKKSVSNETDLISATD